MPRDTETWTINFLPEGGGRITGLLTVSPDQVRFVALYDSSNANVLKGVVGALAGFAATGGHAVYVHNSDTEFELALPRADVASVEAKKKMLMNRVHLTMRNGQQFVFDYGMLSVKKLVDALTD